MLFIQNKIGIGRGKPKNPYPVPLYGYGQVKAGQCSFTAVNMQNSMVIA